MKDVLTYKVFIGSVHFSNEYKVFHWKIEGIYDILTFEARSVDGLIKAFQNEVDDYMVLCKELGKKPEKSYKGSFNVRIPPEIHKKVVQKATTMGMSLNQFVQSAIEKELVTK